jgi:hypothetical protein
MNGPRARIWNPIDVMDMPILDATRRVIERFQPAPIRFISKGAPFDHERRADICCCNAPALHRDLESHCRAVASDSRAFDLYVTTGPDRATNVRDLVMSQFPQARIVICENHGRDMLPFLSVLARIVDSGYRRILKVHSKRTVHRSDGRCVA